MTSKTTEGESVVLKKQLGLISATSYITGNIIGVGIFISPSTILEGSGSSAGVALLVWTVCGAISFFGAMCFADLGTRIKKSGGTYTYIREAFGDLAGFVFLWAQVTVIRPSGVTLSALATSEYIIRPFFLTCPHLAPYASKSLISFVVLGFMMAANLYSVRLAARLQTAATISKVLGLVVLILAGIAHMIQGHRENFESPFVTHNLTPGGLAIALYAGLYAYLGWDNINMAVEELEKPDKNIPIAILGGLAIPTITYILGNIAYHAVLTNEEIMSGVAVAVVFAERKLSMAKWIMLPIIAISASGITNGIIFTACRLNFVGGRDGIFPRFLSMISVKRRTPQPSILVLIVLAIIMSCLGDLKSVLGAYSFFRAAGEVFAILGLFRLRHKYPAKKTTFQVHLLFPVVYILFFLALSITAVIANPREYLTLLIITLLGVPVYYLSNYKTGKNYLFTRLNDWITLICHRLLLCEHASQEIQ